MSYSTGELRSRLRNACLGREQHASDFELKIEAERHYTSITWRDRKTGESGRIGRLSRSPYAARTISILLADLRDWRATHEPRAKAAGAGGRS